jgi:hypothetical protein
MARTATITVTNSSNPATAHIGPFFADVRFGGRQVTKVGTAAMIRDFINQAVKSAAKHGVTLTVKDDTYKHDFTARGGLIGTPFSD